MTGVQTCALPISYLGWLLDAPYYCFNDKHELVRKGNFRSGRPIRSWIYESIYQLSIIQYFHINFPIHLNQNDFDLVSEIIKKSQEDYTKQFGKNNFYTILYPLYNYCTGEEYNSFKGWLDRKKINYIDLNGFYDFGENYSLKGDAHPNANTNKIIANELLKRLK